MFRLTLRAKIMICCISLVAFLDLLVVMFVRDRLSSTLRAESLANGRIMAVNLAARSEHLVLTEEFVSLSQLVADLKESDEDVIYAYVTDHKGRVVAHTFAGGFPRDLVGVNVPAAGVPWSTEPLDAAGVGPVHDISVPLLEGKAGSAHVGLSERRMRRTISRFSWALVVIAAIVLVMAVGLATLVSWAVVRPMRVLTKAAQKIRDGDLGQQVVATTRDEIGDLVEAFNQMSGELLRHQKVLDDRNRRVRFAQEQAAGERDKLRAIIDSMVEGVIFVDAEDRISLCNRSAERIWDRTAEELLGESLVECHLPAMRLQIEEILREAKRRPGPARVGTIEARGGRCLNSYSSVHSEGGRYLGLVMLSLDISERVALEGEHQRLRDQLFQQEKMVLIGQIAASVAHDLNTPLSTILMRAQLLRRQMDNGSDVSDLDVLESEARRCRRIIDALLGFSRRSEGTMSRTDVESLIRESLPLTRNDLLLKGISVEVDYASNGAIVLGDSNQIQQVLLNLISNAADAMPGGGRLQIATRLVPEDSVEIRIADTGCGMEQDVLRRALDPFFTTKERGKGTGLGLAICQRIVEEHEGEMHIESQPGRGTTVSVRLPRAPLEVRAHG